MEVDEACSLINYIVSQHYENIIFLRWCAGYQLSMSYEEFKEALLPKTQRNDKEIIDDTKRLFEQYI